MNECMKERGLRGAVMLLSILAAVVLSCRGDASDSADATLPPDAVVFDMFHTNYAWGFQCGGWYIDASGAVHRYDCGALGDSIRTPTYQGRESVLLERRFKMNDTVVCHVDSTDLVRARRLVRKAALEPPVRENFIGYDAPSVGFYAFVYDPMSGKRTSVTVAELGYWARDPSTASRRRLALWLYAACECRDTINFHAAPPETVQFIE